MTSVSEMILKVPVRGGDLAVARYGPVAIERPTILAVHGLTANSHCWTAVARALGTRASLYAIDLRGRGASRQLPEPYGLAAHLDDLLAVLDHLGMERVCLVGHSLGASIAARFAVEHRRRVAAVVLIDGGLTIPGSQGVDPIRFVHDRLGPELARLNLTFPTHQEYREWWRDHPAFASGQVSEDDLAAFADYDLVGAAPQLRSAVAVAAVHADAADLAGSDESARRLTVPATLLCAPRSALNDPAQPMQPLRMAEGWAAEAPGQRTARLVRNVNHCTIVMGSRGASAVADTIAGLI